ncbi:MAG: DUF262 domain-containing protein [Candidatus Acidiferrales bacterium]|jgi:hypothetical protein
MALENVYSEPTISDLVLRFKDHQINLEPGFQRKSVWTTSDRIRLIQSILAGYPIPSIFLYKRVHNGRNVYDVIDGKQRLETILMFEQVGRFKRDRFDVKLDLGEDDGPLWYDWPIIRKSFPNRRAALDGYKIQTVEVTGELGQIIDLFVRINSTGKRLTSGEKRHAKFYTSRFLKEAENLVRKFHKFLVGEKILTPAQIDRMKGTELFAELLMSIYNGGPINKKTALDRAIGNDGVNGNSLAKISREFVGTLNRLKKMFPELKQTRFRNSAEFYSLFLLIWEMDKEGFVLADRKRNKIATVLLRKLSKGVDELREGIRKLKPPKASQRLYADYLLTVQGDTDSSANRERRRALLKGLLWSLYDRKDEKRGFTSEQRRTIWGTDEKQVCSKCKKPLSWNDYTVDHIVAYSRGGKTSVKNAQPMHKRCNSSKGAR